MMQTEAGVAAAKLHADGGPTRNALLMQFVADITNTELEVAEVAESSAWGAATAGLLGLGVYQSLDELAALPRQVRTYRPLMSRADANRLYEGWQAALGRILWKPSQPAHCGASKSQS
jgi:glycerol kinase